jgi:high-affinity Fe2+/Pb2+ permease
LVFLISSGWLVVGIGAFLTEFIHAGSFREAFEQWDVKTEWGATSLVLSGIVVGTGVWILERWLERWLARHEGNKGKRAKETREV